MLLRPAPRPYWDPYSSHKTYDLLRSILDRYSMTLMAVPYRSKDAYRLSQPKLDLRINWPWKVTRRCQGRLPSPLPPPLPYPVHVCKPDPGNLVKRSYSKNSPLSFLSIKPSPTARKPSPHAPPRPSWRSWLRSNVLLTSIYNNDDK